MFTKRITLVPLLFLLSIIISDKYFISFAQDENEQVVYYQMEPLDDSLFIQIQQEMFIDPPDPKAEIVVDLRDANNQTISIKGSLYPFLALKPETRAKIITYPFKLNLEETINYGSVFVRVIEKLRLSKILNTPSVLQISPTLGYINPFIQVQGGERFGFPIKGDVGVSIGFGTPYSGIMETNFIEANFHILGLRLGIYRAVDAFVEIKGSENHNNLFVTTGFQVAYVIPFGNFFELGYTSSSDKFTEAQIRKYTINSVNKNNIVLNPDGSIKYQPFLLQGNFINWELRYPVKVLGATRGKVYAARYLNETHFGYLGREMTLGGSVFDLRMDVMTASNVRQPQFVMDILVEKIFDSWASSAIAIGPSVIIGTAKSGSLGLTSILFNLRLKVGTSF